MHEHGTVKSAVKPDTVKIDEYSVWVAEDTDTQLALCDVYEMMGG